MADKSIEQLEADRMNKYMSPRNQGSGAQAAAKSFGPLTSKMEEVTVTPKTQQPTQPQPKWKEKQQNLSKGVRLDGQMGLSARVGHLNSLYEQGAINDEEYGKRAEPLHVAREILDACTGGNSNELNRLLNDNPNLDLNNITENEATLLHITASAIRTGKSNTNILTILLENRIQADKKKDGQSPLLTICNNANFPAAAECARILISFGADAGASATAKGKGSAFSCVSAAVDSQGSAELIDVLCKGGANANDTADPHGPVLNYCIIEGFPESALALLRNGANPNSVEISQGTTALASAVTSGLIDVIKLLLQKGADPNRPIMKDQKVTAAGLAKYMAEKRQGANAAEVAKLF